MIRRRRNAVANKCNVPYLYRAIAIHRVSPSIDEIYVVYSPTKGFIVGHRNETSARNRPRILAFDRLQLDFAHA